MPVVRLGNHAAIYKDQILDGEFIAEITVHDDDGHHDQFRNITHTDGLWAQMSAAPAAWVSCPELPRLEIALAAHFDCPVHDGDVVAERVRAYHEDPPPIIGGDGPITNRDEISATVDSAPVASNVGEGDVL